MSETANSQEIERRPTTAAALTRWGAARQRLAAITLVTAALTGATGAALGTTGWHVFIAGAYVVTAATAVFFPNFILAQVISGQLLAGSLLVRADGPSALLLLPLVASVVVTAELLALVARLDSFFERDAGDDLQRAGRAALIGAFVFAAVVLLGNLPGPKGIVAVALASAACIGLAVLLSKRSE